VIRVTVKSCTSFVYNTLCRIPHSEYLLLSFFKFGNMKFGTRFWFSSFVQDLQVTDIHLEVIDSVRYAVSSKTYSGCAGKRGNLLQC